MSACVHVFVCLRVRLLILLCIVCPDPPHCVCLFVCVCVCVSRSVSLPVCAVKEEVETKPVVDPVLTTSKSRPSFVTSACWDGASRVLYTGDFAGQICAWELSGAISAYDGLHSPGVPHTRPRLVADGSDPPLPGVPTAVSAFMWGGRYAAVPADGPGVLVSGPHTVTLHWCALAHKDALASLHLVSACAAVPFVLSAAADACVYAWTLAGAHLGTLCRDVYGGRNPAWEVPFDVAALQGEEELSGGNLCADVRHCGFVPMHDEDYFADDAARAYLGSVDACVRVRVCVCVCVCACVSACDCQLAPCACILLSSCVCVCVPHLSAQHRLRAPGPSACHPGGPVACAGGQAQER